MSGRVRMSMTPTRAQVVTIIHVPTRTQFVSIILVHTRLYNLYIHVSTCVQVVSIIHVARLWIRVAAQWIKSLFVLSPVSAVFWAGRRAEFVQE